VTYSGNYNFPEVLNRLGEHLTYYWFGYLLHGEAMNYRRELDLYYR
jgi:hypothetical protein